MGIRTGLDIWETDKACHTYNEDLCRTRLAPIPEEEEQGVSQPEDNDLHAEQDEIGSPVAKKSPQGGLPFPPKTLYGLSSN